MAGRLMAIATNHQVTKLPMSLHSFGLIDLLGNRDPYFGFEKEAENRRGFGISENGFNAA